MHDRFSELYSRLADKASALFPGVPLAATGHLTCLAKAGEKVTADDAVPAEINRVGTLGAMGPGIFDERFSYVALGHIHRGFSVDPAGRVRYSGTPVQVGVVEPPNARRVLLVDVDAAGTKVESIAVPTTRRLLALQGSLDEVRHQLRALAVPEGEREPYVTVRVTLDAPHPQVEDEVRKAASEGRHCRPRIVDVQASVPRVGTSAAGVSRLDDRAVTPDAAFLFAWRAAYGSESKPTEAVLQRFKSLLEKGTGGAR
jgi:exonuclease SbcD